MDAQLYHNLITYLDAAGTDILTIEQLDALEAGIQNLPLHYTPEGGFDTEELTQIRSELETLAECILVTFEADQLDYLEQDILQNSCDIYMLRPLVKVMRLVLFDRPTSFLCHSDDVGREQTSYAHAARHCYIAMKYVEQMVESHGRSTVPDLIAKFTGPIEATEELTHCYGPETIEVPTRILLVPYIRS